MRLNPLLAAVVLTGVLLSAHPALAFTVDEKSNANADGSPRYVDPDDQPLPFFGAQGRIRNDDNDQSVTPGYATPAFDGSSRPLTFPNSFFSTTRPRK